MTSPIVKRYLIALNKYWFLIPVGILVGVAGGFVYDLFWQSTPKQIEYTITGVLRYNRPPVSFSNTGTIIQERGQKLTQEELLVPNVLESVAARDGVKTRPKDILKATNVRPDKKDNSKLMVIYKTTDESEGLIITTALMEEMVERSRSINTTLWRLVIDEINKRLPAVLAEIRAAEQELEQFIRREQTALLAIEAGQLPGSILSSQEQQRQIKLQLEGISAQMQSLSEQLGLTPEQAYVSAALSADPIIADLRARLYQIETQMQLYSQDLRPDHPTMVQLQRELESSELLLEQRAAEVIGGDGQGSPLVSSMIRQDSNLDPARQQLAQNLVNLQTQRESLQRQLQVALEREQELRQRYETIPNKRLEEGRLQQQLALKKAIYNAMQAKLIDAQAGEAETVSSLAPAELARVTGKAEPNAPLPIWLLLPAGGAAGAVLGGALIFLLGSLGTILQTMEDIRDFLREREVELLGVLPFVDLYDPDIGEQPIVVAAHSPYLEFYERFRSNLRQAEGKPKIILLTSTVRNEGKTVSAYNLAIASARAGKRTLLIEADLRSPSFAKALKLDEDLSRSGEPLLYYSQISECIRMVPDVENLYFVRSFGPCSHAAALIESAEIRQLLEDARGRFDFVVIDSSALSLCNDALLLEPYTDGIVLVTRPRYTGSSVLAESIDLLADDEEFRFLGAIINGEYMPLHSLPRIQAPA